MNLRKIKYPYKLGEELFEFELNEPWNTQRVIINFDLHFAKGSFLIKYFDYGCLIFEIYKPTLMDLKAIINNEFDLRSIIV